MACRLCLLFLVLLIAGCGGEVDLTSVGRQPLKIARFQNGSLVKELQVSPPSKVHEGLIVWATQHMKGWKKSYVTYAPGILVTGTNFTLNVHETRVSLNIDGRQYVRDASTVEFGFLTETLK